MRHIVPHKIRLQEFTIVIIDSGTYWIAYINCLNEVTYFDRFRSVPPTSEIFENFLSEDRTTIVTHNYDDIQ